MEPGGDGVSPILNKLGARAASQSIGFVEDALPQLGVWIDLDAA
jgi:hypothetical protein